jgi:membrane fusion protein, multidrug efflux system
MIRLRRRFEFAGGVWRQQPRIRSGVGRLILLAGMAGAGYWMLTDPSRHPVPVEVAVAARKDVPIYISAVGTVQAYSTVTLHAQVDGQLLEVLFEEGQDVEQGNILARIDPRPFQAQLDQALANKSQDEAQLKAIQHQIHTLERTSKKSGSEAKLASLKTSLHQFEAAVQSDQVAIDNATRLLEHTVITSPITGRTGIKRVDTGNMVQTNDPEGLVDITQMQPLFVLFALPQQELPRISRKWNDKQKIHVKAMDIGNQEELGEGELEIADNQVDAQTGTVRLKAIFPNAGSLLWPGAAVNVKLHMDTRQDAVVIPASSIRRSGEKDYLYVLPSGGDRLEARAVEAMLTGDNNAIILQGLQAGEQVVIQSAGHVQDGSYAEPVMAQPDARP